MNKFNFIQTKIKHLYIIETNIYGDNRGYFFESYNKKDFFEAGYNNGVSWYSIGDGIMAYFLRQKNEERTAAFAEETRPGAFIAPVEYIPGPFLLHTRFLFQTARMPALQI